MQAGDSKGKLTGYTVGNLYQTISLLAMKSMLWVEIPKDIVTHDGRSYEV